MIFANLTPDTACEALRRVGFACSPAELQIVTREERWAVTWGERIAWFASSERGAKRLALERRVLALIAQRCSFQVPRVLVADAGLEVRSLVPGACDPWGLYERCQRDTALAQKIGHWLGAILAEQHARIGAADVAGWLPERVAWPESGAWMRERLPRVIDDADLLRRMDAVIDRYEAVAVTAADRVLVHGDIGLHNIALDPATDAVNGIFDYDSAAWADRHHDFRYLLFDVSREDMLDAALAAYGGAGRIDRERVRLYNAACAISYLAFRAGAPHDEKSCGRTLAQDLRWVRTALAMLG